MTSACRDCGQPIGFDLTGNGRWLPTNADGSPHPATCRKRLENRAPEAPHNLCASCGSDNVERSPGVGPHFGGLRCHDCNAFRWLRKPQETPA